MVNSNISENDLRMNAQQRELYERIQSFSFEQLEAQLPFGKRLARDNGWSLNYAQQVIEEYKKFTFLAVAAGHPVTPSDQVDQAWHLHLSYTRSYWEEFCPKVLQMSLHHDPTVGGEAENQKFVDWYGKTLESYDRFFGQAPPGNIWSTPEVRFGQDLQFVRLNTQQNWVIPKIQIARKIAASVAVCLALLLDGCYVSTTESSNPLAEFLLFGVGIGAMFGLTRIVFGVLDAVKKPQPLGIASENFWSNSNYGCGGGNGSGGGDSSCNDGGSGGDCGGCGGGGCGGGGCGS